MSHFVNGQKQQHQQQTFPLTAATDPHQFFNNELEDDYFQENSPPQESLEDFLKDDDEIEDLGVNPSSSVMQEELLQFEQQFQLQQQVTTKMVVTTQQQQQPVPIIGSDEQKTPKNIIRYHKKQQNRAPVDQSSESVNLMSSSVACAKGQTLGVVQQKSDGKTPKNIQLSVIQLEKVPSASLPQQTFPLITSHTGDLEHQDTIVHQTSSQGSHLVLAQAYSSFNSDIKVVPQLLLNPSLHSQPSLNSYTPADPVLCVLNKALSYFSTTELPAISIPNAPPLVAEPPSQDTTIIQQETTAPPKMTMSEAMIGQFKRENDQLRKEVNGLHEKLFKLKNINKQIYKKEGSEQNVQQIALLQKQVAQITKMYQKEKLEKERIIAKRDMKKVVQQVTHSNGSPNNLGIQPMHNLTHDNSLLMMDHDKMNMRGSQDLISNTQPMRVRKTNQQSMNQEQIINSLQQALVQRDQEILYYKGQIPSPQPQSFLASAYKYHNQSMQSDLQQLPQAAEENVLDEFEDDYEDEYDEEILQQADYIQNNSGQGHIASNTSAKGSQLYLYTGINSTSTELTPYKVMMQGPNNNNSQLQRSYGNIQQNPINTTKMILTTDQFSDHPNYDLFVNNNHSMSQTRSHGTTSKRSYGGNIGQGILSQSAMGSGNAGISTPMIVSQQQQQFYSYEKRPHSPNHQLIAQVPRASQSILQSAGPNYEKTHSPSIAVGVFRTQNPVIMNPPNKLPVQQNLQMSSQHPSRIQHIGTHQSTFSSQQSLNIPGQRINQTANIRQPLKASHQPPPPQLNTSTNSHGHRVQNNSYGGGSSNYHIQNFSGGTPNANSHSLAFQVNTQNQNHQRMGSIEVARQAPFPGHLSHGRNQQQAISNSHQQYVKMRMQVPSNHNLKNQQQRPLRTADDIYDQHMIPGGGGSANNVFEEDDEFGMMGSGTGNLQDDDDQQEDLEELK